MTNKRMFSELVEYVECADQRPWEPRLQVVYNCDIWDSGIVEKRSFMADNLGQITVYLIASEKWSTAHNLSPHDSGVIYGLLLAKWLGWDSTPKSIQA